MTNQGDSVLNSKKSSMAFIVTTFSWQKRLENSEFKTILAEPKILKHANYWVQNSKMQRKLCVNECQTAFHRGICTAPWSNQKP
jgi:hypothetical protein